MNDGSFVAITIVPLNRPVVRANSREIPTAGHRAHPKPPPVVGVTRTMITIPENPMIEPTDRSNSPAIMSSATATARMPSGAALLRMEAVVAQLMKLCRLATIAKRTHTITTPASAPTSGRDNTFDSVLFSRTRSSAGAAAGGIVSAANSLSSDHVDRSWGPPKRRAP